MNVFQAPFLFLMVHFRGRWTHILLIPAVASIAVSALIIALDGRLHVLGSSGLFTKLLAVMPIAGGFFVAALTVILSQSNSVLQAAFVGKNQPFLPRDDEPMTRLRFLALLFGYLSFSSFAITAILAGIDFLSPAVVPTMTVSARFYAKGIVTLLVLFWTMQMFSCSMIGLFYLTDRLYRSTDVSKFKKQLPPAE